MKTHVFKLCKKKKKTLRGDFIVREEGKPT